VLRKSRVFLGDIINAALENCRLLINDNAHSFSVRVPEHPIYLDADVTRMAQVVTNLLDNAFKFTPAGGSIDLTAEAGEHEVAISVRDSGVGIESHLLPRVFDMYFQGESPAGPDVRGLGIGLALVRQLTEAHGGSVYANSEGPGKGSEFVVRLPIEATETEAVDDIRKQAAGERTPRPRTSRKILLVDDNRDSADAMEMLLSNLGQDVRAVYDSEEALKISSEFMPEVAILDIGLPGLNGYQLARHLREQNPQVVLVALSGWNIDLDSPKARDAGFEFIFLKPLEIDKLVELLDNLKPKT
jgi:CheY-like chemotaxis protein